MSPHNLTDGESFVLIDNSALRRSSIPIASNRAKSSSIPVSNNRAESPDETGFVMVDYDPVTSTPLMSNVLTPLEDNSNKALVHIKYFVPMSPDDFPEEFLMEDLVDLVSTAHPTQKEDFGGLPLVSRDAKALFLGLPLVYRNAKELFLRCLGFNQVYNEIGGHSFLRLVGQSCGFKMEGETTIQARVSQAINILCKARTEYLKDPSCDTYPDHVADIEAKELAKLVDKYALVNQATQSDPHWPEIQKTIHGLREAIKGQNHTGSTHGGHGTAFQGPIRTERVFPAADMFRRGTGHRKTVLEAAGMLADALFILQGHASGGALGGPEKRLMHNTLESSTFWVNKIKNSLGDPSE
ncbi:hypothetical protein diail_5270 [Diaporthe ilicicola]|nr:hypothetical protein diail_5270 [Diaporthe ilicicola]